MKPDTKEYRLCDFIHIKKKKNNLEKKNLINSEKSRLLVGWACK